MLIKLTLSMNLFNWLKSVNFNLKEGQKAASILDVSPNVDFFVELSFINSQNSFGVDENK